MARDTDEGRKPPKRWLKVGLIGCVIVPLLVCAFGGFILVSQINSGAVRLPKEVAKLKSLGVPTEAADLKQTVADSDNAATLYGSLCYQLEALSADKSQEELVKILDTYAGSPNPTADLPQALAAIQQKQTIFNDADKLLSKPRLDFKRDYKKGFNIQYTEYDQIKRLVKWECTQAVAQWTSGKRDAALKSLAVALRITEHTSQEPVLIAQLVNLSCHAIVHRALQGFIDDARNDPAMLKRIEGVVKSAHPLADIRGAFGGEVVLGRYAIQGLHSTADIAFGDHPKDESSASALLDTMLANGGIRTLFEAKWCETWRSIFERYPKDSQDWSAVHAVLQDVDRKTDADTSMENTLNRVIFPVLVQSHLASGKQVAERRLQLLALRLLQMRAKGLPGDLSGFGEVAIDPFTGKPMGYEHKGKGFRIWSVGTDLADNGGVFYKPGPASNKKSTDIGLGFDMPISGSN